MRAWSIKPLRQAISTLSAIEALDMVNITESQSCGDRQLTGLRHRGIKDGRFTQAGPAN